MSDGELVYLAAEGTGTRHGPGAAAELNRRLIVSVRELKHSIERFDSRMDLRSFRLVWCTIALVALGVVALVVALITLFGTLRRTSESQTPSSVTSLNIGTAPSRGRKPRGA